MRNRLIALAVAGVLVLALPGAAVGWQHGQAAPQIDEGASECYWHPAPGPATYFKVAFDQTAGKPSYFYMAASSNVHSKINHIQLKAGYITLAPGGPIAEIVVWIGNKWGEDSFTFTSCPTGP